MSDGILCWVLPYKTNKTYLCLQGATTQLALAIKGHVIYECQINGTNHECHKISVEKKVVKSWDGQKNIEKVSFTQDRTGGGRYRGSRFQKGGKGTMVAEDRAAVWSC